MTVKSPGLLNRIRRAFTSSEELEDEVLAQQAQDSGACRLADCKERSRVKVRGTIRWITKEPSGSLSAQLSDGTGKLGLVWLGPRKLECIQPGCNMVVSGRVCAGDDGPEFEIVS